ncbi:MAG TPA: AgmX/PglI C-terminal domain-containing protein, partial [Myxococcales bacterium]|nr:AgmX/PglI C-terminal domain-containing protein [Myxococcales bacterium]
VKARLERADVMQVALAHKEQVVRCRAAALAQDPDLSGQLVLRWTVDVEGQVDGVVEVLPGKLAGTALGDCVAEAVQGWKFPRHAEAQGPITFPFQF